MIYTVRQAQLPLVRLQLLIHSKTSPIGCKNHHVLSAFLREFWVVFWALANPKRQVFIKNLHFIIQATYFGFFKNYNLLEFKNWSKNIPRAPKLSKVLQGIQKAVYCDFQICTLVCTVGFWS